MRVGLSYFLVEFSNLLLYLLYQGSRLHWEAKRGHKGKVKSLVENGTNVDIKDVEGVSTLCYKVYYRLLQ